jgi:hypothetical protein
LRLEGEGNWASMAEELARRQRARGSGGGAFSLSMSIVNESKIISRNHVIL